MSSGHYELQGDLDIMIKRLDADFRMMEGLKTQGSSLIDAEKKKMSAYQEITK